jgi:hypothetical protein
MKDRTTILNLLNKFSADHENVYWCIKCLFSDGMGTTMNEITIVAQPGDRNVGTFTYQVETGMVMHCHYKDLKKPKSRNIVDTLLDMINYSEGQEVA